MNANYKQSKIDWAIKKMAELADDGDSDGIERVNKYAYDFARGSNSRKEQLEAGYKSARASLSA